MENTEEVELTLDNDELLRLCLIAHRRDITLNKLITQILYEELNKLEKQDAGTT